MSSVDRTDRERLGLDPTHEHEATRDPDARVPTTAVPGRMESRALPREGVPGRPRSADIPAFGRCGPDDRWAWLGDVVTDECTAHDAALRGALDAGSSRVGAHARALPLLPAAIGSYMRARLRGG